MAFKPITVQEGGTDSHDDLPWANVWRRTAITPELPRMVHYIREYDSGLMVVTYQYKTYVHRGTQQHTDLAEALQVWSDSKTTGAPLLCSINKRGKPVLGIDEDQPSSRWVHSEQTYAQVLQEPVAETLQRERVNPLLAGRGVQDTARVSVESTPTFPPQDVHAEPSGKGRKGR